MAKHNDIIIDGVALSKDFIISHKSESDFLKTMDEKSYQHLFEGENRAAKLKEVWQLSQPKKDVVPAVADKK